MVLEASTSVLLLLCPAFWRRIGPQDGAHKLPETEAIVRETMATMTTLREK